jgi:UDP-N-acetylmuramyl pentapeptide phosphotransferase/UDP-N-acetylglucosamine-1-phosphate transferase
MIASILGFFLWNYPLGLIFLGDCGAYLIGYWVAILSTLIVIRHNEISPWFALLLNGYPIIETLFTIYRRKLNKRSFLTLPDRLHFHTLFFRRIIQTHFRTKDLIYSNAMTSPYMWIFSSFGVLPAVIFSKSTSILIVALVLLIALYIFSYKSIISFSLKRWFVYFLISR